MGLVSPAFVSPVRVKTSDLDAAVTDTDGSLVIEEWRANPDAPIDCFLGVRGGSSGMLGRRSEDKVGY